MLIINSAQSNIVILAKNSEMFHERVFELRNCLVKTCTALPSKLFRF